MSLIEYLRSIVYNAHIVKNGKHFAMTVTKNVICTQWSTDINVEGMNYSFIEDCVNSCEVCKKTKIWKKVVIILLENLSATLDSLCTKHIVLRRRYKYCVRRLRR